MRNAALTNNLASESYNDCPLSFWIFVGEKHVASLKKAIELGKNGYLLCVDITYIQKN
jgi:hypothetical protein